MAAKPRCSFVASGLLRHWSLTNPSSNARSIPSTQPGGPTLPGTWAPGRAHRAREPARCRRERCDWSRHHGARHHRVHQAQRGLGGAAKRLQGALAAQCPQPRTQAGAGLPREGKRPNPRMGHLSELCMGQNLPNAMPEIRTWNRFPYPCRSALVPLFRTNLLLRGRNLPVINKECQDGA